MPHLIFFWSWDVSIYLHSSYNFILITSSNYFLSLTVIRLHQVAILISGYITTCKRLQRKLMILFLIHKLFRVGLMEPCMCLQRKYLEFFQYQIISVQRQQPYISENMEKTKHHYLASKQETWYAVMNIHTIEEKHAFTKLMQEHPAFNWNNEDPDWHKIVKI